MESPNEQPEAKIDYDIRLTIAEDGGIVISSRDAVNYLELHAIFSLLARQTQKALDGWVGRP